MAEAEDIIELLGLKLLAILGDSFRFCLFVFCSFYFFNDFPSILLMIFSVKNQ